MCVIIYKPAGVDMPTRREFEAAAICNPDGCGFVSSSGRTYRGLSLRSFLKAIADVRRDEECIIHFRYATHGSIKKANCHPFHEDGYFFAHNGILNIRPDGDMTDSETAFRCILYPIAKAYGLESERMAHVVNAAIGGSKFAFMHEGRVKLFGDFTEHNGLFYSNTRHFAYMRYEKPLRSMTWEEYLAIRYA